MTKRIKLHEINKFVRFHKLFYQHFGPRVVVTEAIDQDQLRQIRTEALEFLRSNGFNVDDKMEWISWSDPKEYTLALLRWS